MKDTDTTKNAKGAAEAKKEEEKAAAEVDVMIDGKELEEAARLAAEKENQYEFEHELKAPFTWEGRTYKKFKFDWGTLTGRDGLAIESEMQALGTPVVIPSLSGDYLIRMAARASVDPVGVDVLLALPLRDYNRIRSAARSFLLRTEL